MSDRLVLGLRIWGAGVRISSGAPLPLPLSGKRGVRGSSFDDGRVCLTNNATERALRGIALGRKAWLFAGSDRGAERAAVMYSLIGTARLNDIDPQAWLADVLAGIADTPRSRLSELLPWNWRAARERGKLAA